MRSLRVSFLAAMAALPLGLAGCYEKTQAMDPVSSLSQDGAGGVAFRLSAADLAGLGVAVDSVRIEAERAGFPSRFATGSLRQQVELTDLAAGTWNLKVALYDNASQIHLYGEVLVQVQPGRSVDAEVRLRRATGSVRVHIVIDDTTSNGGIDTLQVQWGENIPSWKPVKYWRTAEGVYLVSTLVEHCFTPYVTFGEGVYPAILPAPQVAARSALIAIFPSQLVLGSKPTGATVCPNLYQERTKFIPWTAPGPLTLYVPGDSIVLADPVVPPPPDTLFQSVSLSQDTSMVYLPILQAYRNDSGISVLTTMSDIMVPKIALIPDTGTLLQFGADRAVLTRLTLDRSGRQVTNTVHRWVFLRWNTCRTVVLRDVQGKTWTFPGWGCGVMPVVDTIKLAPAKSDTFYGPREGLPVLGAWRDDRGVFIATRYDCNGAPQVVETDMFTNTSGLVRFTPVRSGIHTKIGCPEVRHVLFVPTTYAGAHQVADATNGKFYDLPGKVPPSVDSSAIAYRLSILRDDSVSVEYQLNLDGTLHRTITSPISMTVTPVYFGVDTYAVASKPNVATWAPLPQLGSATSDAMIFLGPTLRDSIQKILDLPEVRVLSTGLCVSRPMMFPLVLPSSAIVPSPVQSLPAIVVANSHPYRSYQRRVSFADGKSLDWDVYGNNLCYGVGDKLNPVDAILTGLLSVDGY